MKRLLIGIVAFILLLPLLLKLRGLDHGRYVNDRYVNDYLRMGLALPAGWPPLSRDEIERVATEGWRKTHGDEPFTLESKRAKVLFSAIEGSRGASQSSWAAIFCEARQLGWPGGIASAKYHVLNAQREMEQTFVSRVVRDIAETRLGNVDGMSLFSVNTARDGSGRTASVEYFAFEQRGWSVLIVATYGEEEKDAVRASLESLRAKL